MKSKFIKSAGIVSLSVFIITQTLLSDTITAHATDYNAERDARFAETIQSNSVDGWPDGPEIGAEGAILIEAETGTILYEKNCHEELYPASTTKILTCLLAAENCNMDETVEFSNNAIYSVPADGSNMGMDVGEALSMEDALYGILVLSANETANAVAEHISGSVEEFTKLMNKRATELGCLNSNFVNPNGLYNDNHYTSPYDLARIARAFFSNDLLCKISGTRTYHWKPTDRQPDDFTLSSKNKLLPGGEDAYEYIVGSKTGYTSEARQTLVSCAEKDGMKLICVIMKEESPYQFEDTINLFNYGFSNFQKINIAENETDYVIDNNDFFNTDRDVFGSSNPILSVNASDFIVLPTTATFDETETALSYDIPAEKPNTVAEITYTYHGVNVGSASVDLATDAENSFAFEASDPSGNTSTDNTTITNASDQPAEKNIVFIYVNKVIFWVLGIAGLMILIIVIRAIFNSYHFEKKKHRKRRRIARSRSAKTYKGTRPQRRVQKKSGKKRRKNTRIHFDYNDFNDME